MNKALLDAAARPSLWQRSSAPFWNDSHISKMMLEAHLNPDTDAASRKPEVIARSVEWLSSLLAPRAKLIDLGCGPGLYAKRFSEAGFDVTGVDISENSVEYARKNDGMTRYVNQDYLTYEDGEKYDAALMIYCDYAALTEPERVRLLKAAGGMLRPGGMFIFDVFTEYHNRDREEYQSWSLCENGGFWSGEPHLCLEARYLYENNAVTADKCVVVTADGVKEYIIWDTAYTKQRLTDEVEASGLTVKAVYGGICGGEYDERSDTLCCVAEKS